MISELQKCPCLFATTADNVAVMGRVSNDALSFVVIATTPDGKTGKAELNDVTLQIVKEKTNKTYSWERFFDEIQTAFNGGKVQAKDTTKVACDFTVEGEKAIFDLTPSTDDGQAMMIDALLNYQYIHSHTKEVEKQLDEAAKKETETRQQAMDLEKEEQNLNQTITRSKEQDELNQRRVAELQAELAAAEKNRSKDGQNETITEDEEEGAICRARNPLYKRECKDFDPDILRMVKGKFLKENPDVNAPFHNVIRPWTTSEFAQQTSSFSSTQKQELWRLLGDVDKWEYDVFGIQTQMSGDDHYSLPSQPKGGSLFFTMYALMMRHGLFQKFKVDEKIFLNWLSAIEAGYHGNPYHNSMHAADVLHITHFILSKGGLVKKINLTDEDVLAALFAASIHDYDHPGINNSFHIRAQTYLATLYNDRSILENRHVSSVMELMKLPKYNFLASLSEEQRRDVRETVIEMILATDMGLHGKFVSQWKRRIAENHDLTKKDDVRLALAMAIKMADISNCGRPTNLYLRWSAKIADEFYMQGDRERNFGLSCSPFMDRQQPAMAKGQVAFMNYVVVPLFESISEFLPDMHFSVDFTEQNKSYWNNNPDDVPAPAAA